MTVGSTPNRPVSWENTPPVAKNGYTGLPTGAWSPMQPQLANNMINASRIRLDPEYLSGLKDGSPALSLNPKLPPTGNPQVDVILNKIHKVGQYGMQAFSNLLGDSWRGFVLGGISGVLVGVTGGGIAKLTKPSLTLRHSLPAGGVIGGVLIGTFAATIAFWRSVADLTRSVKSSLKRQYQGVRSDWMTSQTDNKTPTG